MMEIFKTPNPCLLLCLVVLCFTIPIALTKAEATTTSLPENEANNAEPVSNNAPFAKLVGNNGKQSQLGYQQQKDPNYPQQGINQPLSSGLNQPYSATNQPYSAGFNQPFSSISQPFGGTNQRGSMENVAFENGVKKEKTGIPSVALVCLFTLMVCFGF
ncbi:hypothetical protein V6Z11_D06G003300 [Gossypium hirsutum]|uniref:Uncharacterized protein n=1 Tax=Gossypium hirsutum TaxID=3635 RepID=A0A1U8MS56_GOSHI|nr:uncharacterized protein LOC107940723 [Gossypium hirsutum]